MTLQELQAVKWPKLLEEISRDDISPNNFAKQAAGIIDQYDERDDYNLLGKARIAVIIQAAISDTFDHLVADGHMTWNK